MNQFVEGFRLKHNPCPFKELLRSPNTFPERCNKMQQDATRCNNPKNDMTTKPVPAFDDHLIRDLALNGSTGDLSRVHGRCPWINHLPVGGWILRNT